MKKSTLIALSFFAGIALMSACKKDYSCNCSASYMGLSADTTIHLGKMTKKDAQSKCDNFKSQANMGISMSGISGITVSCDITK